MVTEINEILLTRALQIGNGKQLIFPPVSQTVTDNFFVVHSNIQGDACPPWVN